MQDAEAAFTELRRSIRRTERGWYGRCLLLSLGFRAMQALERLSHANIYATGLQAAHLAPAQAVPPDQWAWTSN